MGSCHPQQAVHPGSSAPRRSGGLSWPTGAAVDTPVCIAGRIAKRRQDERHEFKDACGTLQVEIDNEDWPAQAVSEKAMVKLTGEVDRDLTSREIDVHSVEPSN